ncbi:MAG TPA: DUF4350 domain-containing protein, partial [Pyrinomonadaceae bacterium]|nr:DUF4350 domain-containing protein [Pyrinomonadaceae bacterium]
IYPWQMWLDGLYMAEPFYAEYSMVFNENNWDDIVNQFVWMEKNARDPKTGLLYHGWDESRQQRWADKQTGRSPNVWGRAMGWYAMALVDVLEFFPREHPRRQELLDILNRLAVAIESVQDKKTGLWWDILDMPGRDKNYFESSCSAMFVYTMARAVREGYIPERFIKVAVKGWEGIKSEFIKINEKGELEWHGTVSVSGLGGNPYRDGSYEYYMSEKIRVNDPKGLGPAIMAALEMESYQSGWIGRGRTVLLDDYFNHEIRKRKFGQGEETWHYKWNEMADSGYYAWGEIFRNLGARIDMLSEAPNNKNLAGADVYIIVDPDTDKETPKPNYMTEEYAKIISEWVRKGGVLVLLANDYQNAELDKFNILCRKFGLQFNKDRIFEVKNNEYKSGEINIPKGSSIFTTAGKIFLKEISTLKLDGRAKALLTEKGNTIMATVRYGKGTVFALGDPWLYNEYVDGRRLPHEYENFKAAQDLSRWLIKQSAGRNNRNNN